MKLLRLCLPAVFFLAFAAWGQSPSPTPSPDDAKATQLLEEGHMRPHEPAFSPDPAEYVSWEYCRGYADAVLSDG